MRSLVGLASVPFLALGIPFLLFALLALVSSLMGLAYLPSSRRNPTELLLALQILAMGVAFSAPGLVLFRRYRQLGADLEAETVRSQEGDAVRVVELGLAFFGL